MEHSAAAVETFLKLDGIEGESTDAKHRGEIEVESFTWGATNAGAPATGGGGGAGKVAIQDLTVTARVSKASPKLFVACASGQHLTKAQLSVRKAGAQTQDFLKIAMTDVLVTGYAQSAGSVPPMDQVSLRFATIQVSYSGQRPDGSLEPPVTGGWDVKKNAKL